MFEAISKMIGSFTSKKEPQSSKSPEKTIKRKLETPKESLIQKKPKMEEINNENVENSEEHKNQEIPQLQIKVESSKMTKIQEIPETLEIPQLQIKVENSKVTKIQEKSKNSKMLKTEEKPENFQLSTKCDICDKTIGNGNPEILRNHKMIYHEQILRYDAENDRDYFYCKLCTKEFADEGSYRNHQCGSQTTKKTIVKHVKRELKITKKVQASKEPMKPSKEAMKPSKKPMKPSKESLKASKEPTKPSKEPTKPSEVPLKPSKEPTKPSEVPMKPSKEPMKPSKVTKKSNFQKKGLKLSKVKNGNGTKIAVKKLGKMKLQLPSNACKTCGKRFNNASGAKRHQMFVHDKTLRYNGMTKQYFFHCNFCKAEFKKQVEFESHQCEEKPLKPSKKPKIEVKKEAKKIEEKIFKIPVKLECYNCDMEFQSEQKMKSHVAKYHFKCNFCAKIFDHQWYLYDHEETEHGVKKFEKCSLCPEQKFTSKENLQTHCKSEHKIDSQKCICFTLDFQEKLLKHWDQVVESVVPEPSVEYVPPEVYEVEQFCGICKFSTKIYSELETHVLNHPDEIE